MKRLHYYLSLVALVCMIACAAGNPASAQAGLRIVGALSNFDCYNDSKGDCEGFEIEIEGIHKEDVYHTWNFSAFGAPVVTDNGTPNAPSVLVRYHSSAAVVRPGGVTHFGVSLPYTAQAGAILRRWLPKATINVPNPPPIPFVLPSHQAQVVQTNGIETVHNSITNDTPDGTTILWVLPYGNKVRGRDVKLDELMPTNPIITNAVPMGSGSDHLRPSRLDPGDTWASDDPPGTDDDIESGILWFDVYADVAVPKGNGRFDHQPGQLIARVMDATVTDLPQASPTELLLSDTTVFGTQDVIGRVTVGNGTIPAGGIVVQLTSDNPAATVPATITIPVNQISGIFTIHTSAVNALSTVNIIATSGGSSRAASFTIKPPDLYQLWLSFASRGGGLNVDGKVLLTSPAPTGGVAVQLASNSSVVELPASVTVPAGATEVPFTVLTHEVTSPVTVTFSATYNNQTQTTTLNVVPNVVTVSGAITLEGLASGGPAQTVTLTFRPTDGTATISQTVTVGATNTFSFTDLPPKNYVLHVGASKYLSSNLNVNAANGPVTGLAPRLRAGDANSDNSVDVFDLDALIQAFDSVTGDPNWNASADFNNDGSVDVLDLDLLIRNFDQAGDE